MSQRARGKSAPAGRAAPQSINWREFDPSWLVGGKHAPLGTELTTYRDHLDALLEHEGQFVVIDTGAGMTAISPGVVAAPGPQQIGAIPVS
jgi:hypothetical protein